VTIHYEFLLSNIEYSRCMNRLRSAGIQRVFCAALASATLAGCATPAVDPVLEALDERDGTTITRLAGPLTFIVEAPRSSGSDPFAFLAPFESNRMGKRRMHLWVAVPVESKADITAVIWHDGVELLRLPGPSGGANRDAAAVRAPYPATAAWQRQLVVDIDAAVLVALAQAATLTIEMRFADGHSERFASEEPTQAPLQEFRRHLGL
jgi:hypothetical protein